MIPSHSTNLENTRVLIIYDDINQNLLTNFSELLQLIILRLVTAQRHTLLMEESKNGLVAPNEAETEYRLRKI